MNLLFEGQTCYLRSLIVEDAGEMVQLLLRNRDYWSVYEPRHRDSYFSTAVQREKIRESVYQARENREYSVGIYEHATNKLIGHISLYSVKRMPFLSALVGYSIDEAYIGKGVATEAVKLMTVFGFEQLRLHRIEAYVSPENEGSIRVLEKTGFSREGLLKEFLYINGEWKDHFYYAMIEDEF
ncbi:ribosomal-protein-alanine N-acetyltransferase-like protein [Planococcus antarcticus DSM 14505]|uniref:Alanine acetyltransferase n=1 Tax=Planococcus antarcticus DSM 14505 TaxID=1185653 RepID=A0A1C7DJT1_9BACL|nr:GNAT family protein [Planococcus antarcticus]ANU11715.1 alanine acetyltransferase [Planococcus antarcticus DSM 14505]EIM06478.1 ribosomal-protein-alanine N-acetyltransferase-like protein [Planococcus antarcticus DSM 14505]